MIFVAVGLMTPYILVLGYGFKAALSRMDRALDALDRQIKEH